MCIMISASSTHPILLSVPPQPKPQLSQLRFSGKLPFSSSSNIKLRPARVTAAYATAEGTRSNTCSCPPKLASSSLYQVLGIPMGATNQEIKVAYRRLARTCHPDVAAISRKDSSADEFMKIHAAYSTLSDPEKRADYDRSVFRLHRPFVSQSGISASSEKEFSRFSGYSRRNWETDQCW